MQYKRFVFVLFFILMTGINVLRFDVGTDYPMYWDVADSDKIALLSSPWEDCAVTDTPTYNYMRYELVTRAVFWLAARSGSPQLFFFFYGAITCFFTFAALRRHSVDPLLSCTVFLGFLYLESLNLVRQMAAVAIVFYAFRYVENRQWVRYFVFCLIAVLFHKTAFVAVLIYFIYWYGTLSKMLFAMIILILMHPLLIAVLKCIPFLEHYFISSYQGGRFIQYFNVLIVLSLYGLQHYYRCSEENYVRKNRFLAILTVGCMCPFIVGAHAGQRVAYFFTQFLMLLIPLVVVRRDVLRLGVAVGCSALFCIWLSLSRLGPYSGNFPYRFIWEEQYFIDKSNGGT